MFDDTKLCSWCRERPAVFGLGDECERCAALPGHEREDEPADTLHSLRAEIDALKASNAELRASADEAQAARLAAVAEAAALRARVEALEAALRPFAEMVEVDDSDGRRFVGASHLPVKALLFAAADALKGEE